VVAIVPKTNNLSCSRFGITEENKIPITLIQDNALYSLYPLNWKWKNLSDDLIETVYNFPAEDDLDDSESVHLIFSLQDDCIDLIRDYKKTEYHDVAPDTGIVYTTNVVFEDNELNFSLQEYNANYLVVGQNNTMKFWIEFNEDNHIAE